jgi:hypothetical protein
MSIQQGTEPASKKGERALLIVARPANVLVAVTGGFSLLLPRARHAHVLTYSSSTMHEYHDSSYSSCMHAWAWHLLHHLAVKLCARRQ